MGLFNALLSVSLVLSGTASQYAPEVMEGTIRVRQAGRTDFDLPEELPPVDGFVALAEEEHIGRIVFARPYGKGRWESFLVTDCASKNDKQSKTDKRSGYTWMKTSGIVAEVDHETATRWGKTWGGIPVELIIPPDGSFVFPTQLGGESPHDELDGYLTFQLAGFTVLVPDN